jgi:2,3-dihydro-2,3-dihydroxybenzoate dehydrogenase
MNIDFTGKKAVVTGGANGIGLAIARNLGASGAATFIIDLPAEHPDRVAAAFGARGYEADVTDRKSVEAAFKEIGDPDVVVIAAGIGKTSPLKTTTEELWHRTIAVNLTGAFHTLQIAARRMEQRGGSIVLIASTNS